MTPDPSKRPEPSRRLLISFSGGETSGLMAKLCIEKLQDVYEEMIVVFANTGEENEETLEFVDRCDRHFGLNVVWIEAVTNPTRGVGTRPRIVDFATAARNGEPFEAMIAKHGIPNHASPHCTRELKKRPINAYARSIGWKLGTYDTAIGIRTDEIDRMSENADEGRMVYPLVKRWPRRKLDVNEFWERQPFRLDLKGYEGNCRWCFKKSLRKHLTIMRDHPERFAFTERMERLHPLAGSNSRNEPRAFFRGQLLTAQLREMATQEFEPATDDARVYDAQTDLVRMLDLDWSGGCSESCEPF